MCLLWVRSVLILGPIYSVFMTSFDLAFLEDTLAWMPNYTFGAALVVFTDFGLRSYVAFINHLAANDITNFGSFLFGRWLRQGTHLAYAIDLVCSFCGFLVFMLGGYDKFGLKYVFFIIGFIRLVTIYELFVDLLRVYDGRVVQVARFLLYELYWCHVVACVFFLTAKHSTDKNKTWIRIVHEDLQGVSIFEVYVTSLYFAAATVFTIGYGEIHPVNDMEITAFLCVTLVNSAIVAYLGGVFGAIAAPLQVQEEGEGEHSHIV